MAPKFSRSNRVQFCVGLQFAMWDGFYMNMTNLGRFRVEMFAGPRWREFQCLAAPRGVL